MSFFNLTFENRGAHFIRGCIKFEQIQHRVNPRYNGIIGGFRYYLYVRYNRVKGYSLKYTIGYIANTSIKRGNTQSDYTYIGFYICVILYFK
jgi:hypothetical protein